MALTTPKLKIPTKSVLEIINNAKDTSTIATLSPAQPVSFVDDAHMVFSPSSEAEVIAEGANKGSYEQALNIVEGKRFKVVTTTRMSNEVKWADDDNQFELFKAIQADQSAALGRALDYVVYHAINPKSGEALDGYTSLVSGANIVTATEDPTADIDSLVEALMEADINGIGLSRTFAAELRKIRVPATGLRLFPEIPLSLETGNFDGIPAATSGTVNGKLAKTPTGVKAIMGDYNTIKWGYVRDIWTELIEYGDPDGAGVDLKRANQIAFRTEAVYTYALLDPKSFAVLKTA